MCKIIMWCWDSKTKHWYQCSKVCEEVTLKKIREVSGNYMINFLKVV